MGELEGVTVGTVVEGRGGGMVKKLGTSGGALYMCVPTG